MQLNQLKYELKRTVAAFGAMLMLVQSPLGHVTALAGNVTVPGPDSVSDNGTTISSNMAYTENLTINYAYVESPQLTAGQQNILVSAGKGEVIWKNASLTIENTETGEWNEVSVKAFSENVMHFAFDVADLSDGVYRIAKVSYSYMDGDVYKEGENQFSEIESMEDVCFAVNAEVPFAAEEFTSYDESGELVLDPGSEQPAVGITVTDMDDIQVENIASEDDMGPVSEDVPSQQVIAGSTVVFLDAGHDDSHAGARANGLEEEDLTLKVALYCKEYLEDHYSDVVVYMSRETGACPYPGTKSADCNAARVAAAKRFGADVYVSLHFNSTVGTTTANGAMVFYPNSNYNNQAGSDGATLAAKIIEQLAKLGLTNNGIKIRNSEDGTTYPDGSLADYYGVIRRGKLEGIPAVIVEHAFLNNPSDAGFLQSEDNLKALGEADALGIAQAYGLSTGEVEYDAQDLQVTDIVSANGIFKITLSGATPVKRIANIKFKVYPMSDSSKAYTYTAELIDKNTGTYSVVGNVGNHGGAQGEYKVIAYAFDAAGKKTQLRSTKFAIEEGKVDKTQLYITTKVAAKEKTVTLKLIGSPDVDSVIFRVYIKADGKKKAKKYKASKSESGIWSAKAETAKHKKAGEYVVEAYATNYFGTKEKVAVGSYTIAGPQAKKLTLSKLNLDKGTFRVTLKGLTAKAGIKSVKAVVKTTDGKKRTKTYTMKKKSGNYYLDIDMKNFDYQYGTYKIEVVVQDKNGVEAVVKTLEKEIAKPSPKLTMKLKSKHTKLAMSASDLGISVNVKGVKFVVYHTSASSKKKAYIGKKDKDGVYHATMAVSDFGKSGKYRVITYVKGANGKYKKVGKTVTIEVPDVEGGNVTTKKRSSSKSYLYIKDISYKGAISSVEVKMWPISSKKAKYTYKAKKILGGDYRASVDFKNHKGIGGDYKYEVVVKTKNGIEKVLLKGKVSLGKAEPQAGETYAISGVSNVTVSQMVAYYKANATYPSYYATTDAPTLKKFCQIYYDECEAEGIRAEVAFAQAMKETNFLRYGGDVDISQFNFAGLGATGGGAKGLSFDSVRLGVRAQVQHLKAYANSEPLSQSCVDPRFQYVTRGCAPYVEWLGISTNPYGKGWATDPTYSVSLRGMIHALLGY